jgi:hypothetical protein
MEKYYLGDSTLLSFQWELTQGQVGALNCFSHLLDAYLTELLAQRQEDLFPTVIVQLLSQNSQKLGGNTTVH